MPETSYATISELADRAGTNRAADGTGLELALETASRTVDSLCGRRFWQDETASARTFSAVAGDRVYVDDISTSTGLAVASDTSGDGSWSTTWAATDWELGPVTPLDGWPYEWVRAVGSYAFPTATRRFGGVQVTARWGWPAVPAPVKLATLVLAEELWRLKDAPFGVAGVNAFEGIVLRVRQNPYVAMLLDPYRLGPVVA